MITIIVPGTPIAKKRPRFARKGKFVVTYNSQETEEGRFLYEIKGQWCRPPLLCPLRVKFRFWMPIPKGTSKKKVDLMLQDKIQHTKKPDLSNLVKFAEDCCNSVVWKDDSQIVVLIASKFYDDQPKTEIEVTEYTADQSIP
jgi:Holliday junction resolvase RusA-like endonuclease